MYSHIFEVILLIFDISNIGHMKIYTERCKNLGIVVNEHVFAKSESLESIGRYVIVHFMPK